MKFYLCPLLLAGTLHLGFARTLKIEQVLQSSEQSFPLILEALEEAEAAKMDVVASRGEFDLQLSAKGDKRLEGYYDGESVDVVLEKPLQVWNSKIYAGHLNSSGDYPVYEGKMETLENGEWRVGAAISLLQNRAIDEDRLKLWNSELKRDRKAIKVVETRLKILERARKAYWTWVVYGQIFASYKELLETAIGRDRGLVKRVKRGDLAQIYQVENQQYILRRRTQVVSAERNYDQAALQLSFYWRNQKGKPKIPERSQLPQKIFPLDTSDKDLMAKTPEEIAGAHPIVKNLLLESQQFENLRTYGENLLLPKVDLSMEVSRDEGPGPERLGGTEQRAMVSVVIPIERRLGRGKAQRANAMRSAVLRRAQYYREQITLLVMRLQTQLSAAREMIQNTRDEVRLAKRLEEAEAQRFSQGASDFFVVNLREQTTADTQVKLFKSLLDYKKALAEYWALIQQAQN